MGFNQSIENNNINCITASNNRPGYDQYDSYGNKIYHLEYKFESRFEEKLILYDNYERQIGYIKQVIDGFSFS